MKLIEHFVNGKIIPGSSNRNGKVFNPATGEQNSEVRLASKSDLDSTVEIATKAFSIKAGSEQGLITCKFFSRVFFMRISLNMLISDGPLYSI